MLGNLPHFYPELTNEVRLAQVTLGSMVTWTKVIPAWELWNTDTDNIASIRTADE